MSGPGFGLPPALMRKKLLTVLSDSGKTSSLIDNVSIVKRYASESSHAIPVSSDDEALMKAKKEVFILLFFSLIGLYSSNLMFFLKCSGKKRPGAVHLDAVLGVVYSFQETSGRRREPKYKDSRDDLVAYM